MTRQSVRSVKRKKDNPSDDGREWCIVFEGENSTIRSLNAAIALRMAGIESFMLHEWKPITDITAHGVAVCPEGK